MSKSKSQIFGDGNNLIIIFENTNGIQFSYEIETPIITSIQTDFGTPIQEENMIMKLSPMVGGKTKVTTWDPYHKQLAVNIDLVASNMTNKQGKNLLINSDIFKDVKISELFYIIHKKLNERDGNK